MTSSILAKRLGMTPQGVMDLERREVAESITIGSLKKAAAALNCRVLVVLIPEHSLEQTVRDQARKKAEEERYRVVHTMRLEAQHRGVAESLNIDDDVESWLTTRSNHLWD